MDRPRVLIINEEMALRDFFRFNLQARGFDVSETEGNPVIFAMIEREKPDVVILDMMVNGTDGFDLCKKICDTGLSSVIAINMRGGEGELLRCLEMGVDDYLGKPFGVDELLARIGAVLRRRRWSKSPVAINH
jgi:DNA-binding response OmpR family regulator